MKQITLANLAEATEQEIFNQVARHLLKQKVQAKQIHGVCAYRAVEGRMCAAGCLIADDEYTPEFDRQGAWQYVVASMPGKVTSVHKNFIMQLQRLHDANKGVWCPDRDELTCGEPFEEETLNFKNRLMHFAKLHNLEFDYLSLAPTITLANLADATAQEVFDQAVAGIVKQGAQSREGHDGKCLYRGPNGLKCAAGWLMSDDEYTPGFDLGQYGTGGSWPKMVRSKLVPNSHAGLIAELQTAHDSGYNEMTIVYRALRNVAERAGLDASLVPADES